MQYQDIKKRVQAASDLLQARQLNSETFSKLRTLLKDINPRLDKTLASLDKAFAAVNHFEQGKTFELAAESLPEFTPQQKKRKKALLLFLKFWQDLQNEVKRVENEIAVKEGGGSSTNARTLGKIIAGAKGPLGIITLIAAGVVLLKATEVTVVIKNINCQPITSAGFSLRIPGLSLPAENIPPGGQGEAKLPPLNAVVDASSSQKISLSVLGIKYDFRLESPGIKLFFNNQLLNGQITNINLGNSKTHELVVRCK